LILLGNISQTFFNDNNLLIETDQTKLKSKLKKLHIDLLVNSCTQMYKNSMFPLVGQKQFESVRKLVHQDKVHTKKKSPIQHNPHTSSCCEANLQE